MKPPRSAGVTLLELLLVMMIIFILAGVVAPRFSDFFPALQVRKTADQLFAWTLKARAEAAVTGARQRLVLNTAARTIRLEAELRPLNEPGRFNLRGRSEETWPRDVTLRFSSGVAAGDLTLEFRPDGSSEDAEIEIVNDRGDRASVRVDGPTGRVFLEGGTER